MVLRTAKGLAGKINARLEEKKGGNYCVGRSALSVMNYNERKGSDSRKNPRNREESTGGGKAGKLLTKPCLVYGKRQGTDFKKTSENGTVAYSLETSKKRKRGGLLEGNVSATVCRDENEKAASKKEGEVLVLTTRG